MTITKEVKQFLDKCSVDQRREIFQYLRKEFPIHPIELRLNTEAEIILEAISRAGDLTLRGVRGIIAEAAFVVDVLSKLEGWDVMTIEGDKPYDALIEDDAGEVRIQVKMQRQRQQRPMRASEAYRRLLDNLYVVETQRTRGGKSTTGEATRPYRFGEFDILAVSMHPSTNDWGRFMYTVSNWLLADPVNENLLLKFQPVPAESDNDWTDDLLTCIEWLRSGEQKKIAGIEPRG